MDVWCPEALESRFLQSDASVSTIAVSRGLDKTAAFFSENQLPTVVMVTVSMLQRRVRREAKVEI